MRYISTRGQAAPKRFVDLIASGLASDGGLFVPEIWPSFTEQELGDLAGKPYAQVALAVFAKFNDGSLPQPILDQAVNSVYAPNGTVFRHQAITPMTQLSANLWLMELFHGPTFAFKDVALQLLGKLLDLTLQQSGKQITILGATSGDTGSAAIHAVKSCANVRIFMLHPDGKTSDIQRRQMTTVIAPNVHNIALDGSFDDCQRLVKTVWHDKRLAKLSLTAVNSINWIRILAQTVYYVYAALNLGAPVIPVAFAVPTGNFGNIYAAHVARRLGVPIPALVLATNRNDILTRLFTTGKMEKSVTQASHSPSMDIQVASNFERYLLELCGGRADQVADLMTAFGQNGYYALSSQQLQRAQIDYTAFAVDDPTTLAMIKAVQQQTGGMVVDPHTAVGLAAAAQARKTISPDVPLVALACAHPAKFGAAIQKATGAEPPLPEALAQLQTMPESYDRLPADADALVNHILAK